ncbi:MAG: hypothetical protein AAFW70_13550, partial [Cyanobacteria bacterium J06635_10]
SENENIVYGSAGPGYSKEEILEWIEFMLAAANLYIIFFIMLQLNIQHILCPISFEGFVVGPSSLLNHRILWEFGATTYILGFLSHSSGVETPALLAKVVFRRLGKYPSKLMGQTTSSVP